MNKLFSIIKNNKGFLFFILFLFIFRGAIADWHPVPTGSMKPTILEGDVVWENKLAYDLQIPFTDISLMRTGEPKRGDIIVFTSAAADKRMIKRLMGLPGDTIEVKNNQLVINNEAAKYTALRDKTLEPQRDIDKEKGVYALESLSDLEPHTVQLKPEEYNPLKNFKKITVPADHYFFMGDNRDNSADSRYYGFIPRSEIRGHATHILLSLNTKDSYKPRFERFWEKLK
ncbi:MAG: signal peptidase I [Thiotrichales bacterium]|nr:MAG: signal peptidase I [Thiotrichales bacterium]